MRTASVIASVWLGVLAAATPALADHDLRPVQLAPACDAIPTFADGIAPTRELHVALPPRGSNTTGDGTVERPYATIAFAAGQATPGTAVRIHGDAGGGTYGGGTFLNDLHGTAAAPIWIGGVIAAADGSPLPRPIIHGGTEGLHLVRCHYVVVHDLEIRNASGNGVNSDDGGDRANTLAAHHQVFRNLYIHDIGSTGNQDGLKLSGLNDFTVLDCEIARCGGSLSGSGIDMVGCHAGVIAKCFLHDLSANAVQAKGGTADVEIRRCRMVNAGERALNIGGSTGFEFFRPPLSETQPNAEARNIRALVNIIVGSNAPIAFVGARDCVFAHNTIVDPRRWVCRILQETVTTPPYTFEPSGNNTFASNLVYFDRSLLSTFVNVGANTAPATFTFANNLWYAHNNPAQSTPSLPVAETAAVIGQDPHLRNVAGGDYSICADSPAAGAGAVPRRAIGDFRGSCYLNPPAIGAYEGLPAGAGGDPAADLDASGTIDSADFFAFLDLYFGGDEAADFDDSGMVNSTDFFAFLGAMFAVC